MTVIAARQHLLRHAPLVLFVVVAAYFGSRAPAFLDPQNFLNILVQSSSTGVIAVGMTFVLLIAGIDLSVGSVMFVAVAVAGKLVFTGTPVALAFAAALGVGCVAGALNAAFVTRFHVAPFIVTLAMLFVARGFGLWFTKTRAMNLPDAVTDLAAVALFGLPLPLLILAAVCVLAHLALSRTPFGRQLYAAGADPEAARKAGVSTARISTAAYVICGFCAALGGLVALVQTGAVSPTFGQGKEFDAIAAAVLGGTSLFGGRGHVLPGTLLGAVFIHTVQNGLNIIDADPYLYPLFTAAIIFVAVLIDALRNRSPALARRRLIRPLDHEPQ
ncbi:ABC transporter permease [soil metagenome]